MQVNLLNGICSILLLLLLSEQCTANLANRESEPIAANKNGTNNVSNTNYTISNFQTKTVNSANLRDVQIQEAKEAAEKEKADFGTGKELSNNGASSSNKNNSGEKSQSRKITPTDIKIIEPAGNSNAATNNTAVKSQDLDVGTEMVAENVALSDLKGTAQVPQNHMLKAAPTASDSTKNDTNSNTKIFPVKPTTIGNIFPNVISNNSTKTSNAAASTTTTTTTTTSATISKPKKPTATYGIEDFKHLEGEMPFNISSSSSSSSLKQPPSSKLPTAPETAPIRERPNAEPSQEMNSSSSFPYNSSRDYIVPILTILFTVPLAIGVLITAYRRFKDCWSTRHYHRMDFLVDGMYND